MTDRDKKSQEEVIEYFLSHAKGDDAESQISACLARLMSTDIVSHYGDFMKAEMNRPGQHPGHTIGAVVHFFGMMMAFAMDQTTSPRKPGADIEKLVDEIGEVFKVSCLTILKSALEIEAKNDGR